MTELQQQQTDESPEDKPRRWASKTEAAQHARVSEHLIARLTKAGELTSYRLSSADVTRWDLNEIDAVFQPNVKAGI